MFHPFRPLRVRRPRLSRRLSGGWAFGALLGGAVILLTSCIPLVNPATSGARHGLAPIDAIWNAAEQEPKCPGLDSVRLAVMMVAPTYPETGGAVPSPMTLGRWDNIGVWSLNSRLFAFSDPTGPYVHAYFTAGVGMWQFDSAGFWDLTASDAIDSVTAARQAASHIAYRYCNPPSSWPRDEVSLRRYAWSPWYGCGRTTGSICEGHFQRIYRPDMGVGARIDLAVEAGVSRYGGMEQRTCDVPGVAMGVTCWFVDPARAEGSVGWRSGSYNPASTTGMTPLPRPFYVLRANGREYRVWMPADSGYPITITGHKPVQSNARTSLIWATDISLCDTTLGRCSSPPTTSTTTTSTTMPGAPRQDPPSGETRRVFTRNELSTGVAHSMFDFPSPRSARVIACDVTGSGARAVTTMLDGVWRVSDPADGARVSSTFTYGDPGDVAVCGDWDGNGTETPGVFRGGVWYLANQFGTGRADVIFGFGMGTDVPVVGDWNGDGIDTVGVFRDGNWLLTDARTGGFAQMSFGYGNPTDVPVVGDWDGNRRDDPGVFRGGVWYVGRSVNSPVASRVFGYGDPGDVPLFGRWTFFTAPGPAVVR